MLEYISGKNTNKNRASNLTVGSVLFWLHDSHYK